MTTITTDYGSLSILLPQWRRHLRARNLSPGTIDSYLTVGRGLLAYLDNHGMPTNVDAIRREHVESFLGDLADRVKAPTVAKNYRSLQQLWKWLLSEGEITRS